MVPAPSAYSQVTIRVSGLAPGGVGGPEAPGAGMARGTGRAAQGQGTEVWLSLEPWLPAGRGTARRGTRSHPRGQAAGYPAPLVAASEGHRLLRPGHRTHRAAGSRHSPQQPGHPSPVWETHSIRTVFRGGTAPSGSHCRHLPAAGHLPLTAGPHTRGPVYLGHFLSTLGTELKPVLPARCFQDKIAVCSCGHLSVAVTRDWLCD